MSQAEFHYSAYGLSIASHFPIPELPPGSGTPDVVIHEGPVAEVPRKGTTDDQLLFNGLAGRFHIRQGREIIVNPLDGADPEALRVVLMGKAMACLVLQRGWLPLHASAVVIGGKAALFAGPSGAGKSTMAAALHARGHLVTNDDVCPIRCVDGVSQLLPAWSRLRLTSESLPVLQNNVCTPVFQIDKFSVDLGRPSLPASVPVGRIYILDFDGVLRTELLPPLLATTSLSAHSFFRRRLYDVEAIRRHVGDCASIAEKTRVLHIFRPKVFDTVQPIVEFIEADIASAG